MANRKKPDSDDSNTDTDTPELPSAPSAEILRIRITKFGHQKVSTGAHVMGAGDVMAGRGDTLDVSADTARALEARGLAEIVE